MSRRTWAKLLSATILSGVVQIGTAQEVGSNQGSGHHHHHHNHGSSGGNVGSGNFSGGNFGRGGWNGGWSGGWNRSWRGSNLTVVVPGYYSSFGVGSFYPGWSPGWAPGWGGWNSWNGWAGPGFYGPNYGPGFLPYPYVLPPVVLPAGQMYGPRALWNQLGVNIDGALPGGANLNAVAPLNGQGALNLPDPPAPAPLAQQPPAMPVVNAGNLLPAAPPVIAAKPIKLRKSNDAARVRALRLLTVADGDFRAQKYVEAASRYRRAAQTAPDLPEAHFRQAQAEIALSHYDKAAKSCKLGLDADPAWIAAGFRLANLYGPNQAAKTAHLEQLAQEATARPQDADLRFLIGIELFLDGQLERSRKFFEQAAALNAGDDAHLLTFLRELDRQAPVANGAAVDL